MEIKKILPKNGPPLEEVSKYINKYKDEKQNKKFKYSHFISVVINFIQMIFLVFLLI